MKISDLVKFLKKDYPSVVSKKTYQIPTNQANRWGILNSPDYDKDFIGTLVIDLIKMYEWSLSHAKNTWTSNTPSQQAKEYFPKWINDIDVNNNEVCLLDESQRDFLKAYDLDFIQKGWIKFWCPTCQTWHTEIKEIVKDREHVGKTSNWTNEWFCLNGHLLMRKKQSIRIISR